jgi:hypothetical protein
MTTNNFVTAMFALCFVFTAISLSEIKAKQDETLRLLRRGDKVEAPKPGVNVCIPPAQPRNE